MEIRFCIQDPTCTETTYLYEAILTAVVDAVSWRGVYAFASRNGVGYLIEDPVVLSYLRAGGEIDLLVGIDAVTNRATLERLRELEHQYHRFRPRVFWNESTGLFHPKISDFTYEDGRRTLIIGSGNLTPGGLMNHFEGYAIISVDGTEELDVSALDEFLKRHAANIRSIDDKALERAACNLVRPAQNTRWIEGIVVPRRQRRAVTEPQPVPPLGFDRVLIAQVPKAGGRWAQAHFNADVVRDYFRITDLQTHRVCLTHVTANGGRNEPEVRPCVFSGTNQNHKIEIRAARGQEYPNGGPPLLVFRERGLRIFDYMLLIPHENSYGPLMELTERLPSIGKGLPRVVTDMNALANSWPDCPLLTFGDEEEQEI